MVFDCDFSRRTSRPWLGRAPHETRSSMIATVKYMFSLVDIESEGLTRIIGDEGERGGRVSFLPSSPASIVQPNALVTWSSSLNRLNIRG